MVSRIPEEGACLNGGVRLQEQRSMANSDQLLLEGSLAPQGKHDMLYNVGTGQFHRNRRLAALLEGKAPMERAGDFLQLGRIKAEKEKLRLRRNWEKRSASATLH